MHILSQKIIKNQNQSIGMLVQKEPQEHRDRKKTYPDLTLVKQLPQTEFHPRLYRRIPQTQNHQRPRQDLSRTQKNTQLLLDILAQP